MIPKPLRERIADVITTHAGDPAAAAEVILSMLSARLDYSPEQQLDNAIAHGDQAEFERLLGDGVVAADFAGNMEKVCENEQVGLCRRMVRAELDANHTGLIGHTLRRTFDGLSKDRLVPNWANHRHITLMTAVVMEGVIPDETLLGLCGDAANLQFIVRHHPAPVDFLAKLAPEQRVLAMDAVVAPGA